MAVDRPVRLRVTLVGELRPDGLATSTVRVLELSETGAFVEACAALADLQVEDACVLRLAVPSGETIDLPARVARAGASRRELPHAQVQHLTALAPGWGLAFEGLLPDTLDQLRDYLELLESR